MNNNCIFVGRITKNLEMKETKQTGIKYIEFSLAVDNGKDKDGNKRPATFPNFRVWDKRAEVMSQYLHKGSLVMVNASYNIEKWQNENGDNRYTHIFNVNNFMFLDNKAKDEREPQVPDYLDKTDAEIVRDVVTEQDPFAQFGTENGTGVVPESELPF